MNLIVKWGGLVRREEGVNMYAIKQFLPRIPMPEIYGWRTDGEEVFLYMEYIRGRKLDTALEEMIHAEHALAVRDLQNMLSDLRLLRQVERDAFVGKFSLSSKRTHQSNSTDT
jgi:aminoglycoside phosphotransferase (APT) family kinase protein